MASRLIGVVVAITLIVHLGPKGTSEPADSAFVPVAAAPTRTTSRAADMLSEGSVDLANMQLRVTGLHVLSSYGSQRIGAASVGVEMLVNTAVSNTRYEVDGKPYRRLSAHVELVHSVDGSLYYSRSYLRDFDDVSILQKEISQAIGDALEVTDTDRRGSHFELRQIEPDLTRSATI